MSSELEHIIAAPHDEACMWFGIAHSCAWRQLANQQRVLCGLRQCGANSRSALSI